MSVGEPPFQREITQLCSEHHGWLLTWLRRTLGCRQNAADLAQDTFARILNARESLAGIRDPRAYLSTTASRVVTYQVTGYNPNYRESGRFVPYIGTVQADYTHKVVRDDKDVNISTFEPEDQVKLFTTYKLKGNLDKLTVGGGVRWQSVGWQDIYNSPHGGDEEFSQDAYWLVDLLTQYQVSKNLSATLNVNNIFDKSYYTNIGFYNSAAYGEPRNFMVTTRWDF